MKEQGVLHFEEPWIAMANGVHRPNGDGYVVPNMHSIKTRRDAPHLAICMPVGGREVYDIAACEHCHKRTRVRPGMSYHGPGLIPAELLVNFMHLMSPLNVTVSFYLLKNHLSAVLRESMTKKALAAGANFIFFWDDDTFLPPDTWYRMMVHMAKHPDVGLITGVYFLKKEPTEPVLYKHAGQGAYWGFDMDPKAPLDDIYAAGAGCMMARADAVRKMSSPYWFDERTMSDDYSRQSISGHDIRFCTKMKEEAGYRVVVDGSIQCMHFDLQQQKGYMAPYDCPPMEMAREREAAHAGLVDYAGERPPNRVISVEEVDELLQIPEASPDVQST